MPPQVEQIGIKKDKDYIPVKSLPITIPIRAHNDLNPMIVSLRCPCLKIYPRCCSCRTCQKQN